ncbi:MAG: translocation/assembly module TamB domain-containing protein, partial [Caulobacteraceae bacterium]
SATGVVDLAARATGPTGLRVTLGVRRADRILGWPAMGSAGFAGTFAGDAQDWRLAGAATVQGPAASGYRLARASGPLSLQWRSGRLSAKAAVTGEGGAGQGLAAALLGGAPHAEISLVRLADGRLLVAALSLKGRGLDVNGEGERSLLGALAFKGKARLSNFEALARGGAKRPRGVVTASWSAGQAGRAPWRFALDAGAQGFASGLVDVDRLLGPAPRLKAQAAWDGKALQVAHAELSGSAGSASATGVVGANGSLALKLAWSAKGPLQAGPLEIDGAAQGGGALSGSFANPKADLSATFARIALPGLDLADAHADLTIAKSPAGLAGTVRVAASSAYGPARAATNFRLGGGSIALTALVADAGGAHLAGAATLKDAAPSSADLDFHLTKGAFLSGGEASGHLAVSEASGGPRATLTLTAANARFGQTLVRKASLGASGPLASLPYRLQANGDAPDGGWKADGTGLIEVQSGLYGATFSGAGRYRNVDFTTVSPLVVQTGPRGAVSLRLLAAAGGGRIALDAERTGGALSAKASLSGVSLTLVDQDFAGRLDAEADLRGQGASLSGELSARLAGARELGGADRQGVSGTVKAALAGQAVTLDAALGDGRGLTSRAHLVLPAIASAAPFHIALVRNRPIRGDFSAEGQVKPLWDLLGGGERSVSGLVQASGTLGGTLADPEALGEARLSNGQFIDAGSGLKLVDVVLDARLQGDAVAVSQFSAADGAGGTISGSGRVSLVRGGASSFRIDLKRFRLIDNDLASAVASGEATLARAANGQAKLSGALVIDRADIAPNPPVPSGVTPMAVKEVNRPAGVGGAQGLSAPEGHTPALALDVALRAGRGVFVKGRGLNVELSLDAHVGGTTAAPILTGVARMVRGDYDLAGKRFTFDNRGAVYLASSPQDIRLDLTAMREDPTLTAVIRIQGTAARPRIALSSTPALPTDEILAQVLFGTSVSQLSPLDAAEMASALTGLAGGGGFDLVGDLRSFAHLDRLALGGDTAGAIVSGGKYVTNNVYIEIAGGANGPTGAVEWRVRRDLSVVSRLAGGPAGDSQIEVRWRKDY